MIASHAETLLISAFPKKHVSAMLRHFGDMTAKYQQGQWENSMARGGKFIEATLKALYARASLPPPGGTSFKVDAYINGLKNTPVGSVDNVIRLTIPRACRFIYEIASNRGGRHDPGEIDPNEMDANIVVMNCSWILAEMIRHSQRGAANSNDVKEIVESLMRKRYPLLEHIDGRTYFHHERATGVEVALVILSYHYPKRIPERELVTLLTKNRFGLSNARKSMNRVKTFVDIDDEGRFLLLSTGLTEAERIIASARAA